MTADTPSLTEAQLDEIERLVDVERTGSVKAAANACERLVLSVPALLAAARCGLRGDKLADAVERELHPLSVISNQIGSSAVWERLSSAARAYRSPTSAPTGDVWYSEAAPVPREAFDNVPPAVTQHLSSGPMLGGVIVPEFMREQPIADLARSLADLRRDVAEALMVLRETAPPDSRRQLRAIAARLGNAA